MASSLALRFATPLPPVRAEPPLRQAQDDRKYKHTKHIPLPVRAEPALRRAQDDRKYKDFKHKLLPVRAEPALRQAQVDRKYKHTAHKPLPVRAELVEALPPKVQHFDKLSVSGFFCVF